MGRASRRKHSYRKRKRARARDWRPTQKKRSSLIWFVPVIIALVFFVAYGWGKSSPEALEKKTTQSQQLASQIQFSVKRPIHEKDPSIILKYLVENHPSPEISEEFNRRILENDVMLNFQNEHASSMNVAGVFLINIADRGLTKAMMVNPAQLRNSDRSDENLMLILYHEYQHIKQYDRGELLDVDLIHQRTGVRRPPQAVERHFNSEVAAYKLECDLAIDLGWEEAFELCIGYKKHGLAAMRRRYAHITSQDPTLHADDRTLIFRLGNQ